MFLVIFLVFYWNVLLLIGWSVCPTVGVGRSVCHDFLSRPLCFHICIYIYFFLFLFACFLICFSNSKLCLKTWIRPNEQLLQNYPIILNFFLPKLSWLRGRLFKIVLTELNPQWQSWIKDHNIWQLKNRIFFLLFDCLLGFRGFKVK